jgi:hypothetical protein
MNPKRLMGIFRDKTPPRSSQPPGSPTAVSRNPAVTTVFYDEDVPPTLFDWLGRRDFVITRSAGTVIVSVYQETTK